MCQFGLAHVDSPLGDLDASGGALTGPSDLIIENNFIYPYGTTEQFPNVLDSESTVMTNSAHAYTECSNKGICDRQTGTCACFTGYDGSACQRQSCPTSSAGQCSGHGTCETIATLASQDFHNVYSLWDEDTTMGCKCDGGYTGPDCSQRICKYGADPLYFDDMANIRFSNFTYEIYTLASTVITGNYSLWFEDHTGEAWQTKPITITSTCTEVTNALEAIPNNVIPSGSVRCYQHPINTNLNTPIYDAQVYIGGANSVIPKFTLAFPQNPGALKQININKYLDGSRPTLFTAETTSTLAWHIYTNGFSGEETDIVPDYCEGVSVTLLNSGTTAYTHSLSGLTVAEVKLLKTCLGDSDGDMTNNVDVYNWDHGDVSATVQKVLNSASTVVMTYPNPHLIKLVDATQSSVAFDPLSRADAQLYAYPKTQLCASLSDKISITGFGSGWCANRNPPGFYAVLYFNSADGLFNIFTRAAADYDTTTPFYVFTTTGTLQRVSPVSLAFTYSPEDSEPRKIAKYYSNVMEIGNHTGSTAPTASPTLAPSAYPTIAPTASPSASPTSSAAFVYPANYYGNVDCETNPVGTGIFASACFNKNDYVMFLNVDKTFNGLAANPIYPNMHRVKKIGVTPPLVENLLSKINRHQITLDYGTNTLYNLAAPAAMYKFYPPANADKGVNYVGQCSNRGLCNTATGTCQCFPGYTTDNCGLQDSLAK